jgi:hypothetical protein
MAAGMRTLRYTTILVAAILSLLVLTPALASAQNQLQFGAFTPGDPYSGNMHGTDALQASTGRHVDIGHWYQNWGGGDWISKVQPSALGAVTNSGRTPLLTWEPWNPAAGANQPKYALRRIAQGSFDGYIASWARALRNTGKLVYLRPMHEMNGNWYPWSGTVNGNSPTLYIQAWRRMHDIFRQQGASNVNWVWSPNNVDVPGTSANRMEAYYPGPAYVDVLAVDGYNWGATKPEFGGWQTFSQVFQSAYNRLSKLGGQPIWIAEAGAAPEGGSKAAWVRDMFAKAKTMKRLKAIVWFNVKKERDWRAAPNPEVAAAFRPGAEADSDETESASDAHTGRTARLKVQSVGRPRAGRVATVRWKATRASAVTKWHTYLDGRAVRVVRATRAPVLRKRVTRAGRHRWMIVGRDASGRKVVSATKTFRAYRR